MAYTQQIHLFLFFLALTVSLKIHWAEGRQLKAMSKHESSHDPGQESHANQAINLQVNGKKKYSPPVTPTTQSYKFISSDIVFHKDTFQPTTPGNSPGVGHSFVEKKNKMHPNVQHFTSVAGKTDGFQPTTPGHSPGVGHSFGNMKARPNA